ncbi:MAG: hypothetical protein QG588_2147 [Candidatus Poribacteria bacterium]|nr:hypothetical protein [Candidatus Poribacteria bacterium]
MINGVSSGGGFASAQMTAMRGQRENPFKKMDANGDGSLDKTEISALADKISEFTGQSIDADKLMTKLDTSKDGLINQEEFDSGRPQGPQGPPPGTQVGGMQSGGIQSLLGTQNKSTSSSTDPLDTNGDGTVDLEERLAGLMNQIQKYQDQASTMTNQNSGIGSLFNLQS